MKKIITTIIAFLLAATCGFAYADGFSIHSGVKFGMTVDEVKSLEAGNGFSPESEQDNHLEYEGNMAGFDNTSIRYFFDNGGKMSSAYYAFYPKKESIAEAHRTLLDALMNKYGDPAVDSLGNEIKYLNFKTNGNNVLEVYEEFQEFMDCDNERFTQWISPIEDGYVSIMLQKFNCMLGDQLYLSYSYVTVDDYNSYIGDKASEAQEKQEALNSDL